MKTATAQYKTSSTQSFTEILDIQEDIVLMKGGNACLLIELQAANFALLSSEEQDAKVYGYAGLLNSLSFPVQIVIRSKRVDILPYIASLSQAAEQTTNTKLQDDILHYQAFVKTLVTSATILDKQFFLCISYSLLEEGVGSVSKLVGAAATDDDFFIRAKAALHTKAESLLSQIDRMNLRAKIVGKEDLITLFTNFYHEE